MKTKHFIATLLIAFSAGCGANHKESEGDSSLMEKKDVYYNETSAAPTEEAEMADTAVNGFISSTAARANSDTSKKFVRTANMRFKVVDVRKSTFGIEDIVSGFDGFVTYTTLNSSVSSRSEIPMSEDSILVTTRYTVSNTMTIRIPNEKLDSSLRAIAKHVVFLDYRTITAEDVTLQMLSNRLIRNRLTRHGNRLNNAIDNRGKKLNETTNAEGNLLDRQIQADNMLMENLRLQTNVDFSTIQLEFYQEETVQRELKYNDEDIEEYKPGFWSKLGDGFAKGWDFVKELFIGLITIWPVLLLGLGIYLLVKRVMRSQAKK
ncbi:MAG: DUF4349 domain-containing protein [Flavobacteriales bacterium]